MFLAVDGNWSSWSNVSSCSTSCGDGYVNRSRSCDNPSPADGGASCTGASNDTIVCNEVVCSAIHGSWGLWGTFSACSETCGDGTMVRNRSCDSPSPANGGLHCLGSRKEIVKCNNGPCPANDGNWGQWSSYSSCTVSCGGGAQYRNRTCNNPKPEYGGLFCNGTDIDFIECNPDDCPGLDNKGKEFIFGFMHNLEFLYYELTVFITTAFDEEVNVKIATPIFETIFSKTTTVRRNRIEKIQIDKSIMVSTNGIENKGLHIEAEKDIIVYAVNKAQFTSDAFLVLPVDALSNEYYVMTWYERSSFMVVCTEDNTDINLHFGGSAPTFKINGQTKGPFMSQDVNLNKFQTISFASDTGDFTGTHIFASKPVAVFGGSLCAQIGNGACDHLVQQMLPINKWGKDFVTIGMPNCASNDTFRIVTNQRNTIVNISGYSTYIFENPGDFITFSIPDMQFKTISSDKPISVAMFANGGCDKYDNGDPAMVLLPAIQQFASDYTFATIYLPGNDFTNSLVIVIADSYFDGLRFDGLALPATTWLPVEGRIDIKYTDFIISSGVHSIYHEDPAIKFLAVSTGIQRYNSYGYPAGVGIRKPRRKYDFQAHNCTDDLLFEGNTTDVGQKKCDFGLDPCKNSPCHNNGTCIARGWTNFKCICLPQFSGHTCVVDLCKPHPSDIVFVLDNSKSIGSKYFDTQKQYILNLIDKFDIQANNFEIAVVSFVSEAKIEVNFGTVKNYTDIKSKLSKMQFRDDVSQLHHGVAEGKRLLVDRFRRVNYVDVNKYLIILSDGLLSTPSAIQQIVSDDILTRIVAIGADVSHYYLQKITGKMSDVFPPNSDRLLHNMISELIHPVCNVCKESQETDLLIAVDVSRDMDSSDLTEVVPTLINNLLRKIGVENDIKISLLTFSDKIEIQFTNQTYTNDTKYRTIQKMSYFPAQNNIISNFSNILENTANLINNTDTGARVSAKKILLIISQFTFGVNDKAIEISQLMKKYAELFTIGLNLQEDSFQNMLDIASSSFHVGTMGTMFANQIDTFLEAFVNQLSYVKCSIN
ncbi:Coadhesin,Thrombospondin-1,Mucin-like protein,Hemicentin-1,Thrombospondin-2 [Mytilus coruscus]|uniref:Coadhesin,Thrombospondin-1,Mucin-like protein,Hemicentin-1,Thrombospondin-2 n=1 Tax=Mytilus coruscus TaxID=42192 RepID=A0A6J8D8S1_MYTCO|nr:Coadhesin,Thrombospondin-1,Mucin-like protein,Hemicentin-1,Thrombospondin-2 [Mytilus coruscus]